jgi:hypothetical protein
MRVIKLLRWSTVAAGLAVGVVACRDGSTGPAGLAAVEATESEVVSLRGGGNEFEGSLNVWLDPNVAYDVQAGDHRLKMPARVICDPSRTGYGKSEWNKPCSLATKKIQFTIHYKLSKGNDPEIRFSPDIRFAPSSDPAKWVTLSMKVRGQMQPMSSYNILWLSNGKWIDESLTDPSLAPYEDRVGHRVSRRLKHFSGYSVTAGRRDTESESESATGY